MPPRSRSDEGSAIYVAKESFACDVDGENYQFHKGRTRVRASHPAVKANPDYFEPVELEVHYDVEQATAAPGERRGAN